jgi:hypothetical protein
MRYAARILVAIALAGSVASMNATAQQRKPARPIPPGTSTIQGHVIDNVTKAPVTGCRLEVNGSGFFTTVVSGDDGAYQLKDIAAGEYFVNIQCPAHLMICFGSEPASTRADADAALRRTCLVDVVRDQQRDFNFLVTPGAIARGHVLGFDGRPIAGAVVRLGRGMRGEPVPNPGSATTPSRTDTDGRFEIARMPAGEWRLEVEIPPVPGGLTPPIVYYPGGLSWEEATGVQLIAGKVTDNLVVTVPRINENALTVAVPPPDGTITEVIVSVLQQSPLITRRLSLNADGIAVLKGVVPGRYFALALASSAGQRWAGFEVIDFLEGDHEARLQLLPTGSIAGKIVVDKGAGPGFDGVMVNAAWVHDGDEVNPVEFTEARAAADGSFRIDDLYGTRKLQLRAIGPEWEVAAVRQGGVDVTATGVAIAPGITTEVTIVVRRR